MPRSRAESGIQLLAARGKIQDLLDALASERRRAHELPASPINVLLIKLEDLERWLENGHMPESALTCRRAMAALLDAPTAEEDCEPIGHRLEYTREA